MSQRRDEMVDVYMELGTETIYLGAISKSDEGALEPLDTDDVEAVDMEWRVKQLLPTVAAKRNKL